MHIRPLRARATMRSRQPPTSPLPLPVWARKGARGRVRARPPPSAPRVGEEGGWGEGEGAPAVRRSTGTEDVAHPSHRGRATHTLLANGAHPQQCGPYRWECPCRTASTIQVFDHTLRQSPEGVGRRFALGICGWNVAVSVFILQAGAGENLPYLFAVVF